MSDTSPGSASRIFILGSCVSRDAFRLPGHGFELAGYIARTSLASAFQAVPAPAPMIETAESIPSAFQRRMVQIDLAKRAASVLRGAAFDILLVDLIDERFNLARFGGSQARPQLATLSAEFSKACRWTGPRIPPGSLQHTTAWREGVQRLLRVVPSERIVVNRAYWADRLEDGTPLGEQALIGDNNRQLEQMYGYLERRGVRAVIDYPDGFQADPAHHWGVAPFHYAERVYRRMLGELAEIVGQSSIARPMQQPLVGN